METNVNNRRGLIAVFAGLAVIAFASVVGWFAWRATSPVASVAPAAPAVVTPMSREISPVDKSDVQPSKPDDKVGKTESRPKYTITVRNHVRRDVDANDAMAKAIQAYHDTLTCRDYLHQVNAALAKHVPEGADAPLSTLKSTLENLDRISKEMESNRDLCAGATQEGLNEKLVALSLELGLKGYQPAQACFVEAPYIELDDFYRKNAALQEQYLETAPRFMADLLINGDRAATSLAKYMLGYRLAESGDDAKWLEQMPLPAPYLVYRSLRLDYYRIPQKPADRLERFAKSLHEFEMKYQFSDEAIAQADALAHATYLKKYANLPPLNIDVLSGCREGMTQ